MVVTVVVVEVEAASPFAASSLLYSGCPSALTSLRFVNITDNVHTADAVVMSHPSVPVSSYPSLAIIPSTPSPPGSTAFGPKVALAEWDAGYSHFAQGLDTGDCDGDGHIDVATITSGADKAVTVIFSPGEWSTLGGSVPGADYTVLDTVTVDTPGNNPQAVVVADVSGDGLDDVITVSGSYSSGTIRVYVYTGARSFDTAHVVGSVTSPRSLAAGDVDSDGKFDLLVGSYNSKVVFGYNAVNVLYNPGPGSARTMTSWSATLLYNAGHKHFVGRTGDVNHDNRPDIFVSISAAPTNGIMYFESTGATGYSLVTTLSTADTTANVVELADINGDALLDVVGYSSSNSATNVVVWFHSAPQGDFFAGFDSFEVVVDVATSTSELRAPVAVSASFISPASLVFTTPASNATGPHVISVVRSLANSDGSGDVTTRLPGLLDYVSHGCIAPGFVWRSLECKPCSEFEGAHCPGGERFWPRTGYWAASEREPPSRCFVEAACPGALGEVSVYPALVNIDGSRKTDQCALGYTDEYCSVCADGYYMQDGVCRTCGSDAAAKAELAAIVIVASVMFGVILLALLLLSVRHLVTVVSAIVTLQTLVVVGKLGMQRLATSSSSSVQTLARIMRFVALVNFEIEVVRPGCSIPRVAFLSLWLGTLGLTLVAAFAFLVTVWLRTVLAARAARGKATAAARAFDFGTVIRARTMHALIILASLVFLQVSLRTFQALNCVRAGDGSLRLAIELRLRCFEGSHSRFAPGIFATALLFSLGFPVAALLVALRTRKRVLAGMPIDAAIEAYGYIIRGLKPKYLWFRTLTLATTLTFVLETVFVASPSARVFAACFNFGVSLLLVGVLDPFLERLHTGLALASGMASSAQILYFLYRENVTLFGVGAGFQALVLAIIAAVLIVRTLYRSRTRQTAVEPATPGVALDSPIRQQYAFANAQPAGQVSDNQL
ncbi:uncharacterized protein AMSG_02080 [Thecamonas trahens ATCC 50062]|uniref:Uncharacterized protein n=1 Tax=Thecamonas trahens ATCC 50062 TaxID=461836 RepID=A0A0L0DX28_THETB|nr:hypothetical protein AMSG_02080 [Thecamonas trahens ATCC 50062]KNC56068.1 hypothetical protein AMSG_02080 [Thecamonas trahens ATCC 50062]|eukprot:XP_013761112.1 hypothetical protein AMSG_02080 [Thecamonas trahens ATCC 50062]